MPGLSLRMWCVTFSPEKDITSERVEDFLKWVSKHADRWRIITEAGEGIKKHLHAIILFKKEKEKRNLRRALETVFKMSQSEKRVFAAVRRKFGQVREALHGCYDHSFYADYLHKNGSEQPYKGISEVVDDNWVPEEAEPHYVEKEEKVQVNSKFHELYAHYNGEKNLAAWADGLVADDIIDTSFVPVNGEKRFWRHFGLWVKARNAGRHQGGADPEDEL